MNTLTGLAAHRSDGCPVPPSPRAARGRGIRVIRGHGTGAGTGSSCIHFSSARRETSGRCPSSSSGPPRHGRAVESLIRGPLKSMADDGYGFAVQDIRGRFGLRGDVRPRTAWAPCPGPQGRRRDHRRVRHDRLAGQERGGEERCVRPLGRLVPGWADGPGTPGTAPGTVRCSAAGCAGRPVPLRRRAPQRGLPPQSGVPVPGGDGARGTHAVRLRPPRPRAGPSTSGRCRTSTPAISTARCPAGTTCWSTPTTIVTGASERRPLAGPAPRADAPRDRLVTRRTFPGAGESTRCSSMTATA